MSKSISYKRFKRESLLDLISKLYETIERIEDESSELGKRDMYEVYLFIDHVLTDLKKIANASNELSDKGGARWEVINLQLPN